jgi:phosphoenolpyruvate carboxykinase (GTP)
MAERPARQKVPRTAHRLGMGQEQGWLAEHMLILSIESPAGGRLCCGRISSACGRPLRHADPSTRIQGLEGHHHRRRHRVDQTRADGRLYAINPEYGFFGVAPGTSHQSINAMATMKKLHLYQRGDDLRWRVVGDDGPAARRIDRLARHSWTPASGTKAASEPITVAASQPLHRSRMGKPEGVPISALIFGGRRTTTVPLVYGTSRWTDGVCAAPWARDHRRCHRQSRRGPGATPLLPFCGYHMGDYFVVAGNGARNPVAFLRELVPQVLRADSVARVRREHARADLIVDRCRAAPA